jgi:hypothetical protein
VGFPEVLVGGLFIKVFPFISEHEEQYGCRVWGVREEEAMMPHDVRHEVVPGSSENLSELFAEEYHKGTLRLEDLWVWLDLSIQEYKKEKGLCVPPAGDV